MMLRGHYIPFYSSQPALVINMWYLALLSTLPTKQKSEISPSVYLIDINECIANTPVCGQNQKCENQPFGSYTCNCLGDLFKDQYGRCASELYRKVEFILINQVYI